MSELTIERVLELFEERDKLLSQSFIKVNQAIAEVSQEISKSSEEHSRISKENARELAKSQKAFSNQMAEFGDTLSRFAEEQVKADLVNKFEKWGIPVKSYTTHFVQTDESGDFVYEIDILIYDTDFVIAMEVKNQVKKDHIDAHLERLEKIQKYPIPGTKGKIVLGGIATMIVGQGLDKYAESQGLFFLKPSGDTIKIANKKTFKPREWKVD